MNTKKQFIVKEGASLYYLNSDGMGGFLNPPTHPEHRYSIIECRGGHEVGSYSLTAARDSEWLPDEVRNVARRILNDWKAGEPDESWLASVYNYFRHCYSKDGIDRNVSNSITYGKFWGNAELEELEDPTHHLGYLFVKQYYPNHEPDLARIRENDPAGAWSR